MKASKAKATQKAKALKIQLAKSDDLVDQLRLKLTAANAKAATSPMSTAIPIPSSPRSTTIHASSPTIQHISLSLLSVLTAAAAARCEAPK